MLAFIITFIAVFITDVVNAYYIKAITDEKPLTASLWATFVTLTASIAVINFTNDNINLIAALFGAFMGTYVAVRYKK